MKYIQSKNLILLGLIFLFWPFAAFLIAINTFYHKESKVIIYLFMILFGFTFVFFNEDLDSFRYAQFFSSTASLSFDEFIKVYSNFLSSESSLDLAKPIIAFTFSRISNDPRVYYGVIAGIFGYFYLKNISIAYAKYVKKKNLNTLFYFLIFALILNPIFYINGFRFYTAVWIFFFGTYNFVLHRQKKYLWLCFLSCLFHFSFIVPSLVLLLYYFFGNKNKLYYIFFLLSFFIGDIILVLFSQISPFLAEGISAKSSRYINSDSIELFSSINETKVRGLWYIVIAGKTLKYYIIYLFFYTRIKSKKVFKNFETENLFSISLLFLSFSNAVSFIPTLGRFMLLFYLFAILYVITVNQLASLKNMSFLTIIGLIPFLFSGILILRLAIDITNPLLFTIMPSPFIFDQTSIYEFLFN